MAGKLWLISMHLDAGGSRQNYQAALDCFRYLLDLAPLGATPFISVDANDSLAFNPHHPSGAVGPY
eukprot:9207153-Karenia_brevis.AAC.1